MFVSVPQPKPMHGFSPNFQDMLPLQLVLGHQNMKTTCKKSWPVNLISDNISWILYISYN